MVKAQRELQCFETAANIELIAKVTKRFAEAAPAHGTDANLLMLCV